MLTADDVITHNAKRIQDGHGKRVNQLFFRGQKIPFLKQKIAVCLIFDLSTEKTKVWSSLGQSLKEVCQRQDVKKGRENSGMVNVDRQSVSCT